MVFDSAPDQVFDHWNPPQSPREESGIVQVAYQDAASPSEPAIEFENTPHAIDITQPVLDQIPDATDSLVPSSLISGDGGDPTDQSTIPLLPSLGDERRFSFNFEQAPWNWVIKKFSQEAGLSLQMTAAPEGDFTYLDRNRYTLIEALDIFNDYLLAEGFIAIRNGSTLTVLNAQSEIPDGLIPLVSLDEIAALGRNELACVAIPVHNGVPTAVAQELEAILSPLGKAKPLSSSQRVMVIDVGSGLRRMHRLNMLEDQDSSHQCTFVYQLRNTPAEDVALALNDFLTGKRQTISQTTINTPGIGSSRSSTSQATTGISNPSNTGLTVIAEKTTNSLLIRGTASEVAEIQELIVQLDRIPAQVLIQALLVEVELGDTDEFGVELGVQDSVLFDRSVVDKLVTLSSTNTAPNGVQTTTQNIVSQTANPGFNFNNQPLGNNTAVHPSKVGSQALSSLGVGRVNGDLGFGGLVLAAGSDSISVLLRALQQNYHVDILSRPQIRSLDNHEALIQIGRQVPVVDGVSITAVGSANPVIRQDQSGIILKVTPRISPDGQVLIDVQAEKSAYQLTPGTGVPIFTDATNGNVIEAPVKDITTAKTSVNVRSGQTIVLGGMITRDLKILTRQVPFLGDIPYLGELFKYKFNDTKRKELLIFLTPIVIQGDEHADQLKLEEMQRISMPYGDAEQVHGPLLQPPAEFPIEGESTPWLPDQDAEEASPVVLPQDVVIEERLPERHYPPTADPPLPGRVAPPPAFPRPTPSQQPNQTPTAPPSEVEEMPPVPQASQRVTPVTRKVFRGWKPFASERKPAPPEIPAPEEANPVPMDSDSDREVRTPRGAVNSASYSPVRRWR